MTDDTEDHHPDHDPARFCATHDKVNGMAVDAMISALPGWSFIVISIDPTGHRHTAGNVPPLDAATSLIDIAEQYQAHYEREQDAMKQVAEKAGAALKGVLERFATRGTKH